MILAVTFLAIFSLPQGSSAPNPFQFSGFYCVNETYSTNLYYVFLPAESPQPDTPVILWLQGGPGVSSIGDGLFNENGPYRVSDKLQLIPNPYTWTSKYHVLYVDQPAGSGFSYTDPAGYVYWEDQSTAQLYNMLLQFFSDSSIAGESYGGKWVPGISYKIMQEDFVLNLQGMLIGDGLVDPINQYPTYGISGYNFGILDGHQKAHIDNLAVSAVELIKEKKWRAAYAVWDEIVNQYWKTVSGDVNYYDIRVVHEYDFSNAVNYVNQPSVRSMMHTGTHEFNRSSAIVYDNFKGDFSVSIAWKIASILDNPKRTIRTLLYQGQMDWIINMPGAEAWINLLDWHGQETFNGISRAPWSEEDYGLIGYKKKYSNLYEVVLADCGHLAPMDQPKRALYLVSQFIENKL